MPSVTKCTVEPGRGQPSGTSCVTTKAGPHAWLPPQPSAISNVRRPVSIAPRPAVSSRRCRPLDSATRKVIGSAPPTGTSSSPEWKYQSKTAEGLSSGSATKPSSDMDIRAMTLDISTPVRWSRQQAVATRVVGWGAAPACEVRWSACALGEASDGPTPLARPDLPRRGGTAARRSRPRCCPPENALYIATRPPQCCASGAVFEGGWKPCGSVPFVAPWRRPAHCCSACPACSPRRSLRLRPVRPPGGSTTSSMRARRYRHGGTDGQRSHPDALWVTDQYVYDRLLGERDWPQHVVD